MCGRKGQGTQDLLGAPCAHRSGAYLGLGPACAIPLLYDFGRVT